MKAAAYRLPSMPVLTFTLPILTLGAGSAPPSQKTLIYRPTPATRHYIQ